MEQWRTPYLGLRDIPAGLNDFELTTFFSFSAAELAVIRSLQKPLHRFGMAMHMGFTPTCIDQLVLGTIKDEKRLHLEVADIVR